MKPQSFDQPVQRIPVCPQESYINIPEVRSQGATAAFSTGGQATPLKASKMERSIIFAVVVMSAMVVATILLMILTEILADDKDPVFCVESASAFVSNEPTSNLTGARWNVEILAKSHSRRHTHIYDGIDVNLSLVNFDHVVRAESGPFELRKKSEKLVTASTGVLPFVILRGTHELNVDLDVLVEVDNKVKFQATCKNRRFDIYNDGIQYGYGSMVPGTWRCCSKRLRY